MPKLVKGENLTASQIHQVKRAFVHRHTVEHPFRMRADKPVQTDREYINEHAFYIKADGTLAHIPKRCEPVYMAD